MSDRPPLRAQRVRRRGTVAVQLANWIPLLISVYWSILLARWFVWVLANAVGGQFTQLLVLHRWLAWPFTDLPGASRWPLLADIAAVVLSGVAALGLLGVAAGWWREAERRRPS
jgi:hypothetical protein